MSRAELRFQWEPRRKPWSITALLMTAYPNPANRQVMVTLPPDSPEGRLVITDAQGRLMTAHLLKPGLPFLELNVREWAPGLYLGSHSVDGIRMAEVKFNVTK